MKVIRGFPRGITRYACNGRRLTSRYDIKPNTSTLIFEPVHKKTYINLIKTCVTMEDSHQPVHPNHLIRVFADCMCLLLPPGYPKREPEPLSVLGFNNTSTLVGYFVSSPREREKRDSRRDEKDREERGKGMKVKK